MERHLLVVLAHPDDEVFVCAGLMALARRAGVPVTYVCATLGQMGRKMGRPPFATRESLPAMREQELREAMRILGVEDLRLLGLWDKTVEFEEPDEVADRIYRVLTDVRPSTLVTFHPEHGGHPDHKAVGAAAIRAVRRLPVTDRPRVWCPTSTADPDAAQPPLPVETVDIRSVRALKIAAFHAHRSQTEGWEQDLENNPRWKERFQRLLTEEEFWVYPVA